MHPAEIVFEATPNDQRSALRTLLTEEILEPTITAGWLITPIFEYGDWVGFEFNGYDKHIYVGGEAAYNQVTHLIRALELWLTPADGGTEDIDDADLVEEVLDLPC